MPIRNLLRQQCPPCTDEGPAVNGARGGWGTGNTQFKVPTKLALGPDGDLYVTDAGNSRVTRFTNDVAWAQIDIAGTAWSKKDTATCPKGATAFGVRLLLTYLMNLTEKR